jgi:ribonuclease HII
LNNLKKFDNKLYASGYNLIAGIDEAGRGPLAGPVVAAAVIFDKNIFIDGINDSKKISAKKRIYLSETIKEKAISFAFGIVDHKIIDKINILQASLKAMKLAYEKLSKNVDLILIDGNKSFITTTSVKTIVKGDSKSFSIAAASILAKVKRDEIMQEASLLHPQYLWEQNKGYGTKKHIDAIKEFGYTDLHRKTFLNKILINEKQEVLI